MKNKKLQNYLIITLIPIIILLSMIVVPLMTRLFGQEIILETEPIDPRDVFMGDHVILDYKAENIAIEKFPESVTKTKKTYENSYYDYATKQEKLNTYEDYDFSSISGKTLYAVLSKNGEYYDVNKVTTEKPKSELYIKLRKQKYLHYNSFSKAVEVDFGLDKFFVPENSGYDLEDAARHGQVIAKVKVYKGNAVLVNVDKK